MRERSSPVGPSFHIFLIGYYFLFRPYFSYKISVIHIISKRREDGNFIGEIDGEEKIIVWPLESVEIPSYFYCRPSISFISLLLYVGKIKVRNFCLSRGLPPGVSHILCQRDVFFSFLCVGSVDINMCDARPIIDMRFQHAISSRVVTLWLVNHECWRPLIEMESVLPAEGE